MKLCPICKKGSVIRWKRKQLRATKFNPTAKKRKYPNLQWAGLPSGKRIKICARCLKGKKHLDPKLKI